MFDSLKRFIAVRPGCSRDETGGAFCLPGQALTRTTLLAALRRRVFRLCLTFVLAVTLMVSAPPAHAAKDFNVKNDTQSFMFISGTTGNVGVGTTAGSGKLTVIGSGTSTGRAFEIDDSLYAAKVVVLDNGNVGIGTSVPAEALEVAGDMILGNTTLNNALLTIYTRDAGSYLNGVVLVDKDEQYGSWQNPSGVDGITTDAAGVPNGWGSLYLNYYSTGDVFFNHGGGNSQFTGNIQGLNNLFVVGNTGLGTTVPFARLEIDGNIYIPVSSAGKIGVGTSAPTAGLQLGAGTTSWSAAIASQNDAYVTGDLEVDGVLYADSGARFNNVVVFSSEYANTCSGGDSRTINWANGNKQKLTLTGTGACTLTFSGATGVTDLQLRVIHGDDQATTITWPTVKWALATAPTLTTSDGAEDFVSFFYNGSSYYGSASYDFR